MTCELFQTSLSFNVILSSLSWGLETKFKAFRDSLANAGHGEESIVLLSVSDV